jgi:hypothetical protein
VDSNFRSLSSEIDEIRGEPGYLQLHELRLVPAAICRNSAAYLYTGGGMKPPIAAPTSPANSIAVGSSPSGAFPNLPKVNGGTSPVGERGDRSMARVPTIAEEGTKRPNRDRGRLNKGQCPERQ